MEVTIQWKGIPMKVFFDADDEHLIKKYKWNILKSKNNYYVKCNKVIEGKHVSLRLHRLMMGITDSSILVDHINHNSLDNRRINLRVCNNQDNVRNSRKAKNKTSIYLGVYWHTQAKKWCATITINRNKKHLGIFNDEVLAAKEYDKYAIINFGEFANLNFK